MLRGGCAPLPLEVVWRRHYAVGPLRTRRVLEIVSMVSKERSQRVLSHGDGKGIGVEVTRYPTPSTLHLPRRNPLGGLRGGQLDHGPALWSIDAIETERPR